MAKRRRLVWLWALCILVLCAAGWYAHRRARLNHATRYIARLNLPVLAGGHEQKTRFKGGARVLRYHLVAPADALTVPVFYSHVFSPEAGWAHATVPWMPVQDRWTSDVYHGTRRSGSGWVPTGELHGTLRQYAAAWRNPHMDVYLVLLVRDYSSFDMQLRPQWARTTHPEQEVMLVALPGSTVRRALQFMAAKPL